ncbi:MAG: EAL domain-containing protein [Pseudomonadales bacterium]|nr:EAL domain-containing protein [Pseudomonadales bacterium]
MLQRILIVDDKEANLVALESLLSELSVELLMAHSGEEALALLLEFDVSLVLLDVQMPDMDGFEVAELMRARRKTRHIPIIFVTAIDNDQSYVFRGYESGGIDFLQKPIEPIVLVSKVKLFMEIDRQKKMLEDSLREVDQLKTSNELLLKSVGEGILGVDAEGVVTFSNPAAELVLGYQSEELKGIALGKEILVSTKGFKKFDWCTSNIYLCCIAGEKYHTAVGAFRTHLNYIIPVEFTATPVSSNESAFAGVVLIFKDITERRKIETELNYMAQYDNLTGLANRNLFNVTLEQAVSRNGSAGREFALLFIDLDRFKQVNDSLGHEAGDNLLKEATERMKSCVRDSDVVCRLGGDEFTIIIESRNISQVTERVSAKIIRSLSDGFDLMGHVAYIGASIGIVYFPDMADNAADLVKKADTAMYRAKERGRNCYQVFHMGMAKEIEEAVDTESKLRESVKTMDFFLNYQPQIRMTDGATTGVELLLRWAPGGDMISPDKFIPIAEETDLIGDIGEWVIDEACRVIKDWEEKYNLPDDFTVSVNVSVKQFKDGSFLECLNNKIKENGISPARLELEITESLLLEYTEYNIKYLCDIHDLGVGLALDDFGTGYSSMSYLTKIPLNVLKIDRSFIDDMSSKEGNAIVQAIVALAKGLSLKVVAEGVETEDQMLRLSDMLCDYFQGYYFSRPVERDKFEFMLEEKLGFKSANIISNKNSG